MLSKLTQIFKIKELRNSILFVLFILLIFRLVAHIPVPGINIEALRNFLAGNEFLGLLNIFSGGTMANFSIAMLGVAPYITSSIVFQLLGMIVPKFEEMQKEEQGRQKINQYTRMLTVPLALLQSYGMIMLLRQSSLNIFENFTPATLIHMMIVITAGTMFVTWLGELISEKKVGNGISIMIFAGILSGLPSALTQTFAVFDRSQLITLILFVALAILTVIGIVFITEGQRNIPISYARQVRGGSTYGGVQTHLPIRVNQAGVIPIIFAISLVLFPPMVAQFFLNAQSPFIVNMAQWVINVFQNQTVYGILYFGLVFIFTFFYTFVIFHPDQVAENLQKQGGFIPGIRPGRETSVYLSNVTNKVVFIGAIFLGLIAVLPLLTQALFPEITTLALGGTSLLIVVAVVIDIVKQVESQIIMREYDSV